FQPRRLVAVSSGNEKPSAKDTAGAEGARQPGLAAVPAPAKKPPSYSSVVGDTLTELARRDASIVAITAAMPDGTGLTGFAKEHPERFFDVGIAEQHAVTFAAGMTTAGMRPVACIYSTFL